MPNKSKGKHQPILVAVDFSPCSAAALVWAARLADTCGAPLEVVHVVHDPESAPGYYRQARLARLVKKRKKHLLRMEEAATDMMAEFLTVLRKRHPDLPLEKAKTTLVVGLPVTRILEVAMASGASLIVMGSHGRTGLPHLLLGSKAAKVVQLAPMPVTVVKDRPATEQGCDDSALPPVRPC